MGRARSGASRSATRDAESGQQGPTALWCSDSAGRTANGRQRGLPPERRRGDECRNQRQCDEGDGRAGQYRFGDGVRRCGRRSVLEVRMVGHGGGLAMQSRGQRVRPVRRVRGTRQRRLGSAHEEPTRQRQCDGCTPSCPGNCVVVPHSVPDCNSGLRLAEHAADLTQCCYRLAITSRERHEKRCTGTCLPNRAGAIVAANRYRDDTRQVFLVGPQ